MFDWAQRIRQVQPFRDRPDLSGRDYLDMGPGYCTPSAWSSSGRCRPVPCQILSCSAARTSTSGCGAGRESLWPEWSVSIWSCARWSSSASARLRLTEPPGRGEATASDLRKLHQEGTKDTKRFFNLTPWPSRLPGEDRPIDGKIEDQCPGLQASRGTIVHAHVRSPLAASGRRKRIVAPRPTWLSASIRPPCAWMMRHARCSRNPTTPT